MKSLQVILIICFCLLKNVFYSQSNENHPTINDVKISYLSTPQTTLNGNLNVIGITAIPQTTVQLKANINAVKIYYKILDSATDSVLYETNYSLNSSTIYNPQGRKVFENNSGVVFLSSGQVRAMKPYKFQVRTEDNNQVLSIVYNLIR
jgi:hypothetical protein